MLFRYAAALAKELSKIKISSKLAEQEKARQRSLDEKAGSEDKAEVREDVVTSSEIAKTEVRTFISIKWFPLILGPISSRVYNLN